MNFDDFAREAGKALADSGKRVEVPTVTDMSARRRRRGLGQGLGAGFVLLVGAVAVVASVGGSVPGGDVAPGDSTPVSPSSATTIAIDGVGVLFGPPRIDNGDSVEFPLTLLDGTRLSISLPESLAADVRGLVPGGAAGWELDVCCARTLDVLYGAIDDLYGDRRPDSEYEDAGGRPVAYFTDPDGLDYLVFQYGSWVVRAWDGGPGAGERFSEENRAMFASLMNGYETPEGFLVLEPSDPMRVMPTDAPDATLTTSSGEGVVGVIRRDCMTEQPFTGPAVTSQGYQVSVSEESGMTSICSPTDSLFVWVNRTDLSQAELDSIRIAYDAGNETTPPTVSSSTTPATGPLFGEPVDMVLIFDDGIDGVLAVDPDTRVGSRSVIKGQAAGDQPYRLTRVDDHLVVGWGGVYAADLATRDSTLLGNATIYVPAVEPGLVWLVAYPSGRIQGTPSVWQANMAGDQLSDPQPIEVAGLPAMGIPGGLALETDDGVALWDAGSGTVTRRLGTGSGFVSDASADLLAWCVSECSELHITNVSTGDDAVIPARDEDTGFSGRPFGGRSARFSPDGISLAAIAGDNVFLIDTLTGKADLIAQLPTNDPGYYLGWSPDGSQLFISSFSYQQSSTTLLRYDVGNRTVDQVRLPFGGALSFVVVEADAAAPYLRDQDQEPSACRQVDTQPSGRTGICGFRF